MADNDSVESSGNLVNQNLKSSDENAASPGPALGPNRSHFKPLDVVGKNSRYWKHFRVYPKSAKASTLAVCKACYAKHIGEEGVHSSVWEIKIGKSLSTSKLQQHLKRYSNFESSMPQH